MRIVQLITLLCIAVLSMPAFASPQINQQGRLTNAGGPVDGVYTMTFSLHKDKESEKELWSEIHVGVPVEHGIYSLLLGSVTAMPDDIFTANSTLYLQIVIEKEKPLPRQLIRAVPRAFTATHLDCSGCIQGVELGKASVSEDKIVNNAVNEDKIADNAVSTAKLADNAVSEDKLADNAVSTPKLKDAAVTVAKLASNGCGNGQLLKFNGTSWACANDQNTVYNQSCPSGQMMTGINSNGTIKCGTAANFSKCKVCWTSRNFSNTHGWVTRSDKCVNFNAGFGEYAGIGDTDNTGWYNGQYRIKIVCN